MNSLSLRTRIFLSFFILIALSASVVWWVANQQLQEVIEGAFLDAFEEHFEVATDRTTDYLAELFDDPAAFDYDEWHRETAAIAEDLGFTLEILNLTGDVRLYNTATGFVETEIQMYEEAAWLIEDDVVEEHYYDEAQRIARVEYIYYEDEPEFILRMTESSAESSSRLRTRTLTLTAGTAVAGMALLLLLGGWLANALTRPLTTLRQTAQAMAAGKLDARAETDAPAEVRLLADDFNQMAATVEGMVVEQRAFASNAAHELRTPLTGIRLRLETLLEDDPDDALLHRYLLEIDDEVARLSRLVQDLRVLSHSDAQQLKIGADKLRIGPILHTLERAFAPAIHTKQHTFSVRIEGDPIVVAGTNHIRTVLRNLIENAIKYTPEQGTIQVVLTETDNQAVVTVTDNGIGISAENLPKLFNRFYRVDPARNRKIQGSGLGLSLVRSIINLYGGDVAITSEGLDKGTTARLTLPLAQ